LIVRTLPASTDEIAPGVESANSNSPPGHVFGDLLVNSPAAPSTTTTYDEQLGITFAQNFAAVAYNVTAVAQSGPDGLGPAYLLNGLSNKGYWYQVGLTWNWNPSSTPGTGFDMAYEVFASNGTSIFPSNGGGGLMAFSGTVGAGDTVLLALYFKTDTVVMFVYDWNSGAYATQSYGARGATYFAGSPAPSNNRGFFTGLMTEQYHSAPFYGNIRAALYSDTSYALFSAIMWIDEFNSQNTSQVLFNVNSGRVVFKGATVPFSLASNGATEFSTANTFTTGQAYVPFTLSYSSMAGVWATTPQR
jgi:hypothetical protein